MPLKELDAAVARIEGLDVVYRKGQPAFEHKWDPELHCHESDLDGEFKAWVHFKPSSCWSDGGPLIEREGISLCRMGDEDHPQDDYWAAEIGEHRGVGQTPLIAAMRCYVEARTNCADSIREATKDGQ